MALQACKFALYLEICQAKLRVCAKWKPPGGLKKTGCGVKWIPEFPSRTLPLLLVSYSRWLVGSSDSLGVCATRGTSSISDSLLGIEAADVALLVVRVLAAAIPSEDYWRSRT